MGRRDDPVAVVDSQARVIGVQNLRVVDASAMPILPPGEFFDSLHIDLKGNMPAHAESHADQLCVGHPQATICKFIHAFSA